MRKMWFLFGLVAFLCASSASAAILSYDILVKPFGAGNVWFGSNPAPFGLPLQPAEITGTIVVDNTKTDKTGIMDFSMTTGTKTWTEALIDDTIFIPAFLQFDLTGELQNFVVSFRDTPAFLILASLDTMNLDGSTSRLACNDCVEFVRQVPEPSSIVLVLAGALVSALVRRRWHLA